MTENEILVRPETLELFVTELFQSAGMYEKDAAFHAQALVQTNLWGVDSHGVLRVPIYIKRLRSGVVNPRPQIETIRSAKSLEILDGDNGPGFIVGHAAMERAIQLAREFHVGIVGAINSNHFGAAGVYARLAAEQEMIGITMTNVAPNMVVPGSSRPVVGNNPIAVAIPTFDAFPIAFDISLSAVAGGKLLLAMKKGDKIPLDWATDSEGQPTDDPEKAFAGYLLPMAGHKGYGLALIVDFLCGVITGGAFLDQVKNMHKQPDEPSRTSHMMMAINLLSMMDKDEMKGRMASFCQEIKSSPMWDKSKEMLLPGEIEYRTSLERKRRGIPISIELYNELIALGREMGVSSTLSRLDASANAQNVSRNSLQEGDTRWQ